MRKMLINILDVFEESADLAELVLFFIVYSSRAVGNSELNEEALVTFKNMIMDTTGEMTAVKMFENEKAYAKSQWSVWAAYIK